MLPWKDGLPTSVACSAQATIVTTEKGKVFMTGTMHGHVCPSWTRIEIPLPGKVTSVAAGRHFAVALTERNAVVTWGAGHFGQLGVTVADTNGGTVPVTFSARPMLVQRLLHADSNIVKVAAGDWHGLAITESGQVWAWGSNRSLQCGLPPAQASSSGGAMAASRGPTTMPLPLPVSPVPPMKDICGGRSHTLALTKTGGRVYSWGHSLHGQCGTGIATRIKYGKSVGLLPSLVEALPGSLEIKQIAAAGHHSMALTKAGRLFSWGLGAEGELGLHTACRQPHTGSTSKPRLLSDLDFVAVAVAHTPSEKAAEYLKTVPKIVSIQAGASYGTAICSSGNLYCWGSNDVGQLGIPTTEDVAVVSESESSRSAKTEQPTVHVRTFDSNHNVLLPTRVKALDDIRVLSTACGPNHMWCFGEEYSPMEEQQLVVGKTLYEAHAELASMRTDTTSDDPDNNTESSATVEKILPVSPIASESGVSRTDVVSIPTDPDTPSVAPSTSVSGGFPFEHSIGSAVGGGNGRKGVIRRFSDKLLRRTQSHSDTSLSANGGSTHSRTNESKLFGRFQGKS